MEEYRYNTDKLLSEMQQGNSVPDQHQTKKAPQQNEAAP
jgi:hypothetical protein